MTTYIKDALVVERYINSCTTIDHIKVCGSILKNWAKKYCKYDAFDIIMNGKEEEFHLWLTLIVKLEEVENLIKQKGG